MTASISTRTAGHQGRAPLAGTAALVRFYLRRDRIKLPAWAAGIGVFALYVVTALESTFSTREDLVDATSLYRGPLGRLFTGPGYGFDDPSHARLVASGYGLYLMVLAALMSILAVVRHTRVEEQAGRAELVRANVVGPHAMLTAAVIVAATANAAASAVVFAVLVGVGGYGVGGSLLLAASIGAVGLVLAGVTTITVQLSEYSRAAGSLAGAVLGAAFVLRAGGDVAAEGGSALSWLSPLGWAQQTAPFVLDRWWPLALTGALAVLATAGGYALSTRRDLGASMVAVRPGPARAHPFLGTALGLAWRLGRAGVVGWAAALALSALAFGAFAQAVRDAAEDLPDAFVDMFGADDLLAGYLGYLATFTTALVTIYAVLAVQGLRTDEARHRMGPVLATPVSRRAWLGANLAVTGAGTVIITTLAGLATGVGAALATGEAAHVGRVTAAHLNQLPAVAVVTGVAVLCFGALPRALGATWVLVGYALAVATFGELLDLPTTAVNLSPFSHPAQMPVEPFAGVPLLVLGGLAALVAIVGMAAFDRRDVGTA